MQAGDRGWGPLQPTSLTSPQPKNRDETSSSTSKTGPRHRASHLDAAQPGDRAAPPRAPDDDGAARQGAAAVRRAADHHRQARLVADTANGKALNARRLVMHDLQDREVVVQTVRTIAPRFRRGPAATRPAALGFRKGDSRRNRAGRAGRQRVQPARQSRGRRTERRRRAAQEGQGCRRPSPRGRGAPARQEGRGRRPRREAPNGPTSKGPSRKVTTPRKAGGSLARSNLERGAIYNLQLKL